MATYKLMQDIEAEDHILGPLTLRQFIFALIAAFLYYISFLIYTKHVAFLLILFIPPALFFTFFAFPFGKDQPTEVWALAKLRFLFKPRRRVWDQSGMKELVTITAPKKIEAVRTNGLSQTEVKSRLNALASTLDSRGWAVKNVDVNTYSHPNPLFVQSSDRLIDATSMPHEVPSFDIDAADDMLDAGSNPVAQQFDTMITQSTQAHRQQLMAELSDSMPAVAATAGVTPPANYWFMNDQPDPVGAQAGLTSTLAVDSTPEEEAFVAQLKAQNKAQSSSKSHLRTLQPLDDQPVAAKAHVPATPPEPSMPGPDPAILALANNNDLNVATLAREANKAKTSKEPPQDEVVISLR